MKHIETLRVASSMHDVAHILGFKPRSLAYILYGLKEGEKYSQFQIPKQSGGLRTIHAPIPELKTLQSRLSDLLQKCINEINASRNIDSTLSHAFKPHYSIITNASVHRNRRYVFNIDLEDFFGTINFGRVRGFFIKNHNFRLKEAVATVIAQIICHKNALPQGSPCSPVVSNLIGHILDVRLAKLAKYTGCSYSRYADDITFSTNNKSFPKQIAKNIGGSEHQWTVGKRLNKAIRGAHFTINSAKTRMQYQDSRQEVTGLIVNAKVNVRSEYWRRVRAMAHRLFMTGAFQITSTKKNKTGEVIKKTTDGRIEQLHGMLSFIDSVDVYNERILKDASKPYSNKVPNSRVVIYQRFLFYKHFFNPSTPIILCEGKTDNVYLKAAINQRYKSFPELAGLTSEGKLQLKVQFFKYTPVTARVSGLGGGAGDLLNLIRAYSKNSKHFKAQSKQHPVIILTDNDKGVRGIFSYIKQNTNTSTVDGSKHFYHIRNNLYIVAIPKKGAKDTSIEDYFSPDCLQVKLNGKSFNTETPFDPKTEYGKHLFAEHVIKKNKHKINFKEFDSILERISTVLSRHNS